MAGGRVVVFVFLSSFFVYFTVAVPEKGIEVMDFDQNNQQNMFSKSLFKDATLIITTETPDDQKDQPELALHWSLYISDCAQAFMRIQVKELPMILASNHVQPVLKGNATGLKNLRIKIRLNKPSKSQKLKSKDSKKKPKGTGDGLQGHKPKGTKKKLKGSGDDVKKPNTTNGTISTGSEKKQKASKNQTTTQRGKRSVKGGNGTSRTVARPPKNKKLAKTMEHGKDGNYLLVVEVSSADKAKPFKVQVTVKMKSNTGYLSAAEWPLLPFYGGMSLVYLAYGVVWLIVSACQWRELLRIQFWIGGVIALGMLEKAVLFSEYSNVNNTGIPAHGLVVFAQVLSCIKRTLSRILIIIVSMGFGIVKPRLGAALHRVLGVAFLYFILCVIEGSYREITVQADITRRQLLAAVPLSVLDAVICWWIFMSLMQTMRTLRIRKNVVKLSLYRHFTNILAVAVVASVAFMIWVIRAHHFNPCIKDWKELWIDDAFWHFLFALVLLAIMILWRPTANNQRYAFTPLIDVGDDDNDDMTLSDAFHGMKMRNKSEGEAPSRAEKNRSKLEDDLKWVEENIPTAGGIDTALPTLLDSDEEVMTTKLEMSKME